MVVIKLSINSQSFYTTKVFDNGFKSILVLNKNGTYELTNFELTNRYDMAQVLELRQNTSDTVISAIYFEGTKQQTFVKRFKVETTKLNETFSYIGEHAQAKLYFATAQSGKRVEYNMKVQGKTMPGELSLDEFIDVKGWKALGNKLTEYKITTVKEIENVTLAAKAEEKLADSEKIAIGTEIEFDMPKGGEQANLF